MLTQNATIVAALIGAAALILGSVLGGFIATFFTYRMNSKAEKRKVVREKIEEIYNLSNQMQEYSTKRVLKLGVLTSEQYYKEYVSAGQYLLEEDNSVQRMRMLASLYIPGLVKDIDEFRIEINRANRRIEKELDPKGRSIAILGKDVKYNETGRDIHSDIANVHEKLRTALSNVITKY